MRDTGRKPNTGTAAVICLCFLLTSTGYLAWFYNLMDFVPSRMTDAITLAAGYGMQAAGTGLFAFCLRRGRPYPETTMYAVLPLYIACLIPSVTAGSVVPALVSGMALNLLCGWIAGYYLYKLTVETEKSRSAVTLGVGYGVSIVLSWILSAAGKGSGYSSGGILVICLILAAAVFLLIRRRPARNEGAAPDDADSAAGKHAAIPDPAKLLLPAGALVLLFSIVNSCGFGFPSEDVVKGINVEFSRLFYAAGLLIAGSVNDRSRKSGAVCALSALVIPFIMIALRGEPVSAVIIWALSYFVFGFYSVYRMILFSDIAGSSGWIFLSGFGLLIGRIGDAAGEMICLSLKGHTLIFLVVSAILFMAAVFLFFRLYPGLYLPAAEPAKNEMDRFNLFSARYVLSAREREVLRLLLEEKTNMEIADALSVSESTVKFHVHNLLQKTGCRNRSALFSVYYADQDH